MLASAEVLEVLKTANPWWRGPFLDATVPRASLARAKAWVGRNAVLAICGMRRCGKTTLSRQLVAQLLTEGVSPKSICFVDLEEPLWTPDLGSSVILDRIFETFVERVRPDTTPYLVLDEIQNVEGWARWVRGAMEHGRSHFVVTGSSSKLLEPELAAVLTGRTLRLNLWPFSFGEMLRARGVAANPDTATRPAMRRWLIEYLEFGGLPEIVFEGDTAIRQQKLKHLFRDIIHRDIVSRYEVRNVRALEALAVHFLATVGGTFSFHRLKNLYGLPTTQAARFTDYLTQAFLVGEVRRFTFKASERETAARKVYPIDVGLRNAVTLRFSQDLGRLAEAAVYHALRRDEDLELFYFLDRRECDFVTWRGTGPHEAIQVCFGDEAVPERERLALLEAMDALGLREGTIVTDRVDRDEEIEGRTVHLRPLWRWLLEREPESADAPGIQLEKG